MQEETLRVTDASGKLIFSTGGKWLHPLFALEDYIALHTIDVKTLSLEDKIIGLGAAALIIRMGFVRCRARLLSCRAVPLLEKYRIDFAWDEKVDKLGCMTEDIISVDAPLDESYDELSRRAGRSPAAKAATGEIS
ncbi:MAG: DUF1893 domain-containing protein [Treponemataceae bacterium]